MVEKIHLNFSSETDAHKAAALVAMFGRECEIGLAPMDFEQGKMSIMLQVSKEEKELFEQAVLEQIS